MAATSEQADPVVYDEIQAATDYLATHWRALSPVERQILTTLVERWVNSPPCRLHLVPRPPRD